MPKKKAEQTSLFGDHEKLCETLAKEMEIVDAEVEKAEEAIDKKEKQIEKLDERRRELFDALATAKKLGPTKAKAKK